MKYKKYIKEYKRAKRKKFWLPIFGTIVGLSLLAWFIYLWIEMMVIYNQAIGL